jgi:hypothetical protein
VLRARIGHSIRRRLDSSESLPVRRQSDATPVDRASTYSPSRRCSTGSRRNRLPPYLPVFVRDFPARRYALLSLPRALSTSSPDISQPFANSALCTHVPLLALLPHAVLLALAATRASFSVLFAFGLVALIAVTRIQNKAERSRTRSWESVETSMDLAESLPSRSRRVS